MQRLVRQRNRLYFFSAVLSLAVLLLSILLFLKKERWVIVPTQGASFWIEENRASSAYIEKMGLFLADLLLNRSPSDVDKKNKIVLEYAHPSFYQDMHKSLTQEKEAIIKGNQSFVFRPERTYVEATESFVIEGEFFVFIGKRGESAFCTQQGRKKYTLGFCCQHGKLLLTSLKSEEI